MAKTLLFQGDSVTDCDRQSCGRETDGWGLGYPRLIGAFLTGNRPSEDWRIINRGLSGHRVVDLYARWKVDALNLKPDIISILVGVNDTWH